jgi:nucleotide-binding universal stress UspA family protein
MGNEMIESATRSAIQLQPNANAGSQPIVVGVDGSSGAVDASRWAGALAAKLDLPLHLVTAAPYAGHVPSDLVFATRVAAVAVHGEWADRYLQAARQAVEIDHPEVTVTTVSATEPADEALVKASATARLAVLGCDDVSALGACVLGSTTLATLAHADCPVVAWRGADVAPSQRPILVGVDGSGRDGGALSLGFDMAARLGSPLWVIHSWSLRGMADKHRPITVAWDANTQQQWRRLNDLLEPWGERYPGVHVTRIGESAKASHALLLHARCAQLVVVGSRRRRSFRHGFLGSTSLNLLHHCPVPVILCPFEAENR